MAESLILTRDNPYITNADSVSSLPIDQLLPYVDMGKHLFKPEGIDASGDGSFMRFFSRDTYITILNLVDVNKKNGIKTISPELLLKAAISGLTYIGPDGNLAHEAGTKANGYPFEVDRVTGIGKHFGSVDSNGWAIAALLEMYEVFIENKDLFEQTMTPMITMLKWSMKNIKENKGMIGHIFNKTNGPVSIEGSWQDGKLQVLTDRGEIPAHPVFYVLEQALYYSSMEKAADFFASIDPVFSLRLRESADQVKVNFNKNFRYDDQKWGFGLARAVDAKKQIIHSSNIDELIVLGFMYGNTTILDDDTGRFIKPLVDKLVSDLMTPWGALRTQGRNAPMVDGFEYHGFNSIWPFANVLVVKALERLRTLPIARNDQDWNNKLHDYAMKIALGTANVIIKAGSPVETVRIDEFVQLCPYKEVRDDGTIFENSKVQAWTVGALEWLYSYFSQYGIKYIPISLQSVI